MCTTNCSTIIIGKYFCGGNHFLEVLYTYFSQSQYFTDDQATDNRQTQELFDFLTPRPKPSISTFTQCKSTVKQRTLVIV